MQLKVKIGVSKATGNAYKMLVVEYEINGTPVLLFLTSKDRTLYNLIIEDLEKEGHIV